MTAALALGGIAVATWVLRATFTAIVPPDRLPGRLRASLDHLPPAAMAALVASSLAGDVGVAAVASPALLAVLVTAVVASRTENLLVVVAAGVTAAALLGA